MGYYLIPTILFGIIGILIEGGCAFFMITQVDGTSFEHIYWCLFCTADCIFRMLIEIYAIIIASMALEGTLKDTQKILVGIYILLGIGCVGGLLDNGITGVWIINNSGGGEIPGLGAFIGKLYIAFGVIKVLVFLTELLFAVVTIHKNSQGYLQALPPPQFLGKHGQKVLSQNYVQYEQVHQYIPNRKEKKIVVMKFIA